MSRSTRRLAAVVFVAAVIAGCSMVELGTPPPTLKPHYTNPPPTPTLSAIATVAPTGHGHPYTPEDISALFLDSVARYPAGTAPELQGPAVVRAIAIVLADDISTYDGQPYQKVSLVGRCGVPPIRCELKLKGIPRFSDGHRADSYIWEVRPQVPLVTLISFGGGGFPADLIDSLDALARSLDTEGKIGDRRLESVQWALGPPDDAYVLRYGHGLDEGDPRVWVKVDRAARTILSIGAQP